MTTRAAVAFSALLCTTSPVLAQPTTAIAPPLKLQFERGNDIGDGSVALAEGVASAQPVRFALEGLDVSQPVSVVVSALDPAQPLTLQIAKDDFAVPERSATSAEGTATLQFRTQGDFGISVTSSGPLVPFLVAVWAGPIQPAETPTFLAPVKSYDRASLEAIQHTGTGAGATTASGPAVTRDTAAPGVGGVVQWALVGVGAMIAVALLFVGVVLLKRRPTAAQTVGVMLMVATLTAQAQPQPRFDSTMPSAQTTPGIGPGQGTGAGGGSDLGVARTDPAMPAIPARQIPAAPLGLGGSSRPEPQSMRQITPRDIEQMHDDQRNEAVRRTHESRGNNADPYGMRRISPADIEEMRREAERERMRPFARNDNVQRLEPGRDIPTPEQAQEMMRRSEALRHQAMENFRQAAAADARTTQALRDALERTRNTFRNGINGGAQAANIAYQAWQLLHPSDNTCLANTAPAEMPIVPSMCAGSGECSSCYGQAYGRLNRTRGNLEKLRCIYQWNQQYAERAKSFGDNVSSVHGISGLAWQQERRKIEKAMDQLGQTYDAKYRELLGYAREDLGHISACEAQFFDNPDWATRYGFMFYGFLEDRYRR